ncbi:bifunctional 2-polyprenyl-6-hydroxyphenol methylase/3-demethylubiquinol 3-O-methyltransferase UbiG [Lewinella sp. 4G2]|uniref:class I SAM-dependent methyltransferase n=1 Tax=Lewinella sp. 4G2 TaxID=1803372 RepID=UPI0007B46FF6|nr:class I SAM-dependent methyltransferase [Lewinella sp. 4G2]OAV43320.1 hypothetical protein A3850_001885 [Lewinella sp. 4G2]
MPLLTRQDFIDVYQKLRQRGSGFLLSKLNPNGLERTKSAFDESSYDSSNWWIIPAVRRRWNILITGDPEENYESFAMRTVYAGREGLRMLSIGSGVCSHEMIFAGYPEFASVTCVDIVPTLLEKAKGLAAEKGIENMEFVVGDIRSLDLLLAHYDVVLFHASLHHISDVEELLTQKVKSWLRPGGTVMINEYVGPDRLQYPREQISYINKAIQLLPESHRTLFRTGHLKQAYYGVGSLRMRIADPSECVESSHIMPTLRRAFRPVVERAYGGNLLMATLKDISHHFVADTEVNRALLEELFALEDAYLEGRESDFVFGIYGV